MTDIMLTTIDNPFNPFEDYDRWYAYDSQCGYKTCEYFARIAQTTELMSEIETDLVEKMGIIEIARENPLGIHRIIADTGEIISIDEAMSLLSEAAEPPMD